MKHELSPFRPMTDMIQKRRREALERAEIRQLSGSILRTLLILAVFVLAFQIWFSFKIVDGNGMFPALSDGDLTLCYRQDSFVKNDVVFYTVEGVEYVGRVAAKAGDYVEISEEGTLRVNGTPQTGEIVYPTYPPTDWEGGFQVPENTVFILGDHRIETLDSRDFGCIPLENVEARVFTLIRHRGI